MKKVLASIVQRPMALIFLLFFVGGCGFLIFIAGGLQPPELASGEIQYDDERDDEAAIPDTDNAVATKAVGGPAQIKKDFDVEIADSGDAASEYVVVSEQLDSSDACTQFEKYDQVRGVCFFTCDTTKECDQIEESVNRELDEIEASYEEFANDFSEVHSVLDPATVLARYAVEAEEWIELESGVGDPSYKQIWLTFAEISPDEISNKFIERFVVYRDAESDTAAYVEQISGVGPKWALYVNIDAIDESSEEENMFLLTHEFAHILTLNVDQVDPQVEESVCARFYSGEGCATRASYIGAFFERFWSPGDLLTVDELAEGAENPLYRENPQDFITEYAATNPGEDIAESFTSFVFKRKPIGDATKAEEKMIFFYDFPELVTLRTQIRQALGVERKFERR